MNTPPAIASPYASLEPGQIRDALLRSGYDDNIGLANAVIILCKLVEELQHARADLERKIEQLRLGF